MKKPNKRSATLCALCFVTASTLLISIACASPMSTPEPTLDIGKAIDDALARQQAATAEPTSQTAASTAQPNSTQTPGTAWPQNHTDATVRQAEIAFQLNGAEYLAELEAMPAAVMACAAEQGQYLTLASSDAEWSQATADNIECIKDAIQR